MHSTQIVGPDNEEIVDRSQRYRKIRWYRRVRSRLKHRIRNGANVPRSVRQKYNLVGFVHGYRPSSQSQQLSRWLQSEVPRYEIVVPEIFCLYEDPEAALKFLQELDISLRAARPRNVFLSHRRTRKLDLAASWLFDLKIKELRDYWEKSGRKFFLGGEISDHHNVNRFLAAFGTLKQMGIDPLYFRHRIGSNNDDQFLLFHKTGSSTDPAAKGSVSIALTSYFDKSLRSSGKMLSNYGRGKLVDAFGEILGNAEEHPGAGLEWTVLGCFDSKLLTVGFSILNDGMSIYQSLSDDKSTSKEVLSEVAEIIRANRPSYEKTIENIGSLFTPQKTDEPIWNVMALQEGISSKRTATGEGSTRGQGLMDVIEFFTEVKGEEGYITVISGSSYILIDFKYPVTTFQVGQSGETRRRISFNTSSDLREKQDPEKVRYLKARYPGTMISGSFKLPTNYVENIRSSRGLIDE